MIIRKQKRVNELGAAAHAGDLETVKRLVEKGVPVDWETSFKLGNLWRMRALEAALRQRHEDIAKYLIAHGATVDNYDIDRALSNKMTGVIELLDDKNIPICGTGEARLRAIVATDDPRILAVAIRQGVDKSALLEAAAAQGKEGAVCYLMEQKTEVTRQAVRNARANDNPMIAELLGLTHDYEEQQSWQENLEKIAQTAPGRETVIKKALVKIEEMVEAAREVCADERPKAAQTPQENAERQERLAKLRETINTLESGLNVLRQSPYVDFSFTVKIDEERGIGSIKTNIKGDVVPVGLAVIESMPEIAMVYTGRGDYFEDDSGRECGATLSFYHSERNDYWDDSKGYTKLNVERYKDASQAIGYVIKEAFAKNAVKPSTDAKLAAQTAKQATEKPGGNAP